MKFDDRKTRTRGFSFIEVMVCLSLLGLLLSIAVLRQGSERSRASSQAIAREMVAELKAARAKAMAQGRPVAVCWPGGGKLSCQSFYIMEGVSKGRITRSRDFSQDFDQGYLAVGFWKEATITPSSEASTEVNPATWLPSNFSDYAMIFDGHGRVVTNDLPLQDGSYHILACSAVGASTGTPIGTGLMVSKPAYHKFSRASGAHTITVAIDGTVGSTEGMPGLAVDAHPFPMDPPVGPRRIQSTTFASPTVESVALQPSASLAPVGTITRTGSLNVAVKGSDPSGDDLFLEWSAEKLGGASTDEGYFSRPGRVPMDWNPKIGQWESTISWTPPDDAAVGDTFKLSFVMSNSAGTMGSDGYAELSEIEIVKDDLLFATGALGIYKIHANGTGFDKIMSNDKGPGYINVSPDGSRIIWDQSAWDRHAIWVGNIDGSGRTLVTNGHRSMDYPQPVWNETGTTILMAGSSSGQGGVLSCRLDGTGLTEVLPRVPGHNYTSALDISRDGRYIAAIQHVYLIPGDYRSGQSRDLWLGKLDQSTYPPKVEYWTNLSRPGGQVVGNVNTFLTFQEAYPNPDQPVLVVRAGGGGNTAWVVQVIDTGSSFTGSFTRLNDERGGAIADRDITFSPDGTRAVGVDWTNGELQLYDWSAPRLVNKRPMHPGGPPMSSVDWR